MKGHFNTFKVYLKQIKDVKMFNVLKCSKIHPKSVLKAVFRFLKKSKQNVWVPQIYIYAILY